MMPVCRKLSAAVFAMLFLACILLTGCLSHWFLESSSRLQVENATENFSIVAVDVASIDGTSSERWIMETILPGERSRVVEKDWVGKFTLRVRYTESRDASGDTLDSYHEREFDGGSLYLKLESHGDSLKYVFH